MRSRNILLTTAERMIYSAHNYWLVLVGDVVGAIVFLVFGIRHLSGSTIAAGASVIVGFIAWGFLEYGLHRWVLHGRPSMARRGHARHHADATALISTPALVVLAAACAMWATLSVIFPTDVACLLVFGLYAGYNYYALLHHLQHRRGTGLACLAGLERVHRIHHERHTVNYGVTTTLWDRLLGTFQPSHESGNDRQSRKWCVFQHSTLADLCRHEVHPPRRPGHPHLRAAPPTGHIHGRRQAADSADGSMVR